jgi:hypothetical protein
LPTVLFLNGAEQSPAMLWRVIDIKKTFDCFLHENPIPLVGVDSVLTWRRTQEQLKHPTVAL